MSQVEAFSHFDAWFHTHALNITTKCYEQVLISLYLRNIQTENVCENEEFVDLKQNIYFAIFVYACRYTNVTYFVANIVLITEIHPNIRACV